MMLPGVTSKSCLFLTCPTDCLEPILTPSFKGQALFYSSLGVHFKWDKSTQEELCELLKKRDIRQVVILTKLANTFFKEKLRTKYNLAHYAVERSLQQLEDELPESYDYWECQLPKLKTIAADYLEMQKDRILKTKILGQELKTNQISVLSLLYDERNNTFYNTKIVQQEMALYEAISVN